MTAATQPETQAQEEAPDNTVRIPQPQIAGWTGGFEPYVPSGNVPEAIKTLEFHVRDPQTHEELLALVGGKPEVIDRLAKAPLRTYFTRAVALLAASKDGKALLDAGQVAEFHEWAQDKLNTMQYEGRAAATPKAKAEGKRKQEQAKAGKYDAIAQIAAQDPDLLQRLQAYGIQL